MAGKRLYSAEEALEMIFEDDGETSEESGDSFVSTSR